MKKYLTVFAAVVLGGCAHAEYQAEFLDEYADYSCAALRGELSQSRQAMEGYSQDKRMRGRVMVSAEGAQFVFVDYADGGPPRWWGKYHRERMQAHARHQSILDLQERKGCGNF